MSHPHEHHRPLVDRQDWNERYLAERGENIWSGHPNGSLIAEVGGMEPGRAIDLGCGEGADAIWLAEQGWTVTGVDISEVAIDRARAAAAAAGVEIEWICADFVDDPPEIDGFDLVTTHYPALLQSRREDSITALLAGVRPGGTLLFVHHLVSDSSAALSHGFDPDDYIHPEDLREALGESWVVVTMEVRERVGGTSDRSPHTSDVVLRAVRSSTT